MICVAKVGGILIVKFLEEFFIVVVFLFLFLLLVLVWLVEDEITLDCVLHHRAFREDIRAAERAFEKILRLLAYHDLSRLSITLHFVRDHHISPVDIVPNDVTTSDTSNHTTLQMIDDPTAEARGE